MSKRRWDSPDLSDTTPVPKFSATFVSLLDHKYNDHQTIVTGPHPFFIMSGAPIETRLKVSALESPGFQQSLDFGAHQTRTPPDDVERKSESVSGDQDNSKGEKANMHAGIEQDDGVTRIEALCKRTTQIATDDRYRLWPRLGHLRFMDLDWAHRICVLAKSIDYLLL
jgi:hypothetical protein